MLYMTDWVETDLCVKAQLEFCQPIKSDINQPSA